MRKKKQEKDQILTTFHVGTWNGRCWEGLPWVLVEVLEATRQHPYVFVQGVFSPPLLLLQRWGGCFAAGVPNKSRRLCSGVQRSVPCSCGCSLLAAKFSAFVKLLQQLTNICDGVLMRARRCYPVIVFRLRIYAIRIDPGYRWLLKLYKFWNSWNICESVTLGFSIPQEVWCRYHGPMIAGWAGGQKPG
jgi:hypothetical protein